MRDFTNVKRIVIKIGTNTLSIGLKINVAYINNIASQINTIRKKGKQVILVTSGAIGMGAGQLGIKEQITGIKMRQACASVGQPLLMHEYKNAFSRHNIVISQVLLTADVLDNRKTYLNLRNTLETLLQMDIVPILNENDCVATEEIGSAFGDNDRLSALIASKLDADLLILLSDIDALYDRDPKKNENAGPVHVVYEITDKILKSAGKRGSAHATGGMKTKLLAAQITSRAGCRMILAHGRERDVITRIIDGQEVGTLFMPKRKLSNRRRWILNSSTSGVLQIDQGAVEAIKKNKSLLPSGIISVDGNFEEGSIIMLNKVAKAVTSFGSAELRLIAGKHSQEIKNILGRGRKDVVATPENIVFLDY